MIQLWTRLSVTILAVCGPTLILGDSTITVNKATWDFNYGVDLEIPGVKTVEKCQELCLDDPENCCGYTHMTVGLIGYCYKFKVLTGMHGCETCSSGTSPQLLDGSACTFNKEIKLSEESAESVNECWQKCFDTTDCLSFTWHNANSENQNVCDLFSQQCTKAAPCEDCLSGHVNRLAAPAQCYEYNIMDEESRNSHAVYGQSGHGVMFADYLGDQKQSQRWVGGDKYYRMMGAAGTRIPEREIAQDYCLAAYPGHLAEGSHPTEVGVAVERIIKFTGSPYTKKITITRCPDGYFVYSLPQPINRWYRYCAE